MKRSGGLTVVAVLLVLGGAVMGFGSLFSFVAGPRALDTLAERLQEQLDQAATGTGPDQLKPEQLQQLRQRLPEVLRELRDIVTSPTVRATTIGSSVLGIVGLIAGIGIFLLRDWARMLAVWQAACSIPFGLFAVWSSPQRRISLALLRFSEAVVDPATLQGLRESMMSGEGVGRWLGVLTLLVWNGLLLWFLTRASVKAQFEKSTTS